MYKHSVVGGTFDRFHRGHRKLLDTAFAQSENVTIGISTEKLYMHKLLASFIEDFHIREAYIKGYLKKNNFEKKGRYIPIEDIYGTTLENENIDAIFVTEENKKAADLINQKRIEIEFHPLKIIVVPFEKANDGIAISSERIRKGEIDRSGFAYQILFGKKSLALPEALRAKLKTPIGFVFRDLHKVKPQLETASMIITVGDIVSFSLANSGIQADLSIIDFKTQRHELKVKEKELLEKLSISASVCSNEAGKIEKEATSFIENAIQSFLKTGEKQTIRITGEEDLLTLPTILFAPLQAIVIYGQFDEGAVLVEVTEQKKREILEIVKLFS